MVAIKRLHDAYARDPEFVAMLLDEARLASTIRHPNVVPTLDVVAEQDELLVVMEYVEGDSLASLARLAQAADERIPIPLAASIVAQVLHGLHAAHEARDRNGAPLGIVHRDVSPQNVLVGVDGVARVLDFGIAKAASRATSTDDGQLKGKAAYMAPEQLQHGSVDRRTDVFAAAIMFWELLTGRRLFLGDSPAQTMGRILHDPIDSPLRWAPDVPIELSLITMRGLERDPDARFASAEEMALAIEDAIALPRPKEIGQWISRVAASSISTRAELVREIERESSPMRAESGTNPELRAAMEAAERRREMADVPTDVGRVAQSSGEVNVQWAMAASAPQAIARPTPGMTPRVAGPFAEELTDLATVRSSADFAVAPAPRVSRVSVVVAIVGGLALASAIVLVVFITRHRSAPAQALETPPPAVTAAELRPPPEPAPTASEMPSAPATSAAPPSSAPAAAAGKRRGPRGGSAGKPDCRIPYVVDEKGLKHFKVECL